MCCESNRRAFWSVLSGFMLLSVSGYTQTNRASLPSSAGKELKVPYAPMALNAELIGPAISEKDWFNWCVSPIQGKDGKIHIFSSRWPAAEGMEGWYGRNAEIAHFVAERPEGPFTYVGKVMTTDMFPDPKTMSAPHNPRLEYVDGKYILLYICQNPSRQGKMRVGMMIADRLEGPWRFAGDNGGIMGLFQGRRRPCFQPDL